MNGIGMFGVLGSGRREGHPRTDYNEESTRKGKEAGDSRMRMEGHRRSSNWYEYESTGHHGMRNSVQPRTTRPVPIQKPFNFLQVSPVFFPPIHAAGPSHLNHNVGRVEKRRTPFVHAQLETAEFRAVLVQTLPRVAVLIGDDRVFGRLLGLDRLPEGDDGDESDSSSWSEDGGSSGGRRRASLTFFTDLFRCLAGKGAISCTVLILSLRLVLTYHRHSDKSTTKSHQQSDLFGSYHLLLVGMMLANKYTEDRPLSNASWSRLTRIPGETLNRMEAAFLRVIGHRICVQEAEFGQWMACLGRLLQW